MHKHSSNESVKFFSSSFSSLKKIIANWSSEGRKLPSPKLNCPYRIIRKRRQIVEVCECKCLEMKSIKSNRFINQEKIFFADTLILAVVVVDDNESCLLSDIPSLPFVESIVVDVVRKSAGKPVLISLFVALVSFKLRRRFGFFKIRLQKQI